MIHVKTCPLCDSHSFSVLYETKDRMFELPGKFGMNQCDDCHAFFLSPRPTDTQLALYYPKENYYAYQSSGGGFFGNLRNYLTLHYYKPTFLSTIISTIVHNVPALPKNQHGGRVLDVGCGTGETLCMLKTLGFDVYGMDIDKKAVSIAKKRGVTHVRVGAYEDIAKYDNGFFDVIRLYHVIEHLDDPLRCMELLYKKLKKGGELIIGTPNPSSVIARLFGAYWYNLDSPRHLVLFSPTNLRQSVEKQKFTVRTIEYCSAGGFIGSIQYVFREKFGIKWDLIHTLWMVVFTYPVEWLLDKFHLGDVFVLRMIK